MNQNQQHFNQSSSDEYPAPPTSTAPGPYVTAPPASTAPGPYVTAPPASTAPGPYVTAPPAGYPMSKNDQYPHNHVAVETKSRGDGFWKGCCAALCCCCLLDACF